MQLDSDSSVDVETKFVAQLITYVEFIPVGLKNQQVCEGYIPFTLYSISAVEKFGQALKHLLS